MAALGQLPVGAAASAAGYERVARFGAPVAGAPSGERAVPLTDAWRSGAQLLTQERRVAFANDPRNRLAVDERASGCAAAAQRIAVKRAYGLRVTPTELVGLRQRLAGCGSLHLPF